MEYIYVVAEQQLYGEDINRFYLNSEEEAKSVFKKIKLLDNEKHYVLKKIELSEPKKILSQIAVMAWIYRNRAEYHSYFFGGTSNSRIQKLCTLGLDPDVYKYKDDDNGEDCCKINIIYTFHLDDVDIKYKKYAKKIEQYIKDIIKEEGYNSFFNHTEEEIRERLKGIKLE